MNTRVLIYLFWVVCPLIFNLSAEAQVPFLNGGVVAFEPEISTVTSGSNLVVTPTVSNDHKYVTIGGQFQNAQVLRLQTIQVQSTTFGAAGARRGLVGNAQAAAPSADNPDNFSLSRPLRVRRDLSPLLLRQPGMTLIAPLP